MSSCGIMAWHGEARLYGHIILNYLISYNYRIHQFKLVFRIIPLIRYHAIAVKLLCWYCFHALTHSNFNSCHKRHTNNTRSVSIIADWHSLQHTVKQELFISMNIHIIIKGFKKWGKLEWHFQTGIPSMKRISMTRALLTLFCFWGAFQKHLWALKYKSS